MTQALLLTLALVAGFSASAASKKETKPVGPEKAGAADAAAVAKGNKPAASATPDASVTQLDLLKGEWTACRPFTNETGEIIEKGPILGLKDVYSRVSAKSFSQSIGSASDKECKKIVSETRTTFDCDMTTPELVSCRTTKREERKGGKGKWKSVVIKETDEFSIKVGVTQKDPDTIELNIHSDETEGNETFELKRKK